MRVEGVRRESDGESNKYQGMREKATQEGEGEGRRRRDGIRHDGQVSEKA